MISSSTPSSLRRVLSICNDANTHEFLKQALHASDTEVASQNETTELLNPTSANMSAISFGIVSVEDWQTAFQHIAEGKQNSRSFRGQTNRAHHSWAVTF